jgi:hypothetical protein
MVVPLVAPRALEEHPDYQALAEAAEASAATAATPQLAEQWRNLAETYRKLAPYTAMLSADQARADKD